MSKGQRSSRVLVSRFALIAIIGGMLLSFAGAATNAANFSLVDSVRGLFGLSSPSSMTVIPQSDVVDDSRSPQAGTVSLTTLGSAYTQNFDTLAATGTSSTVPTGWDFAEADTNANTTYSAGTGSSGTGDTYSFGATSATDRAFGGLQSGSLNPTVGASFTNNTGSTITSLAVSFTGEQWRLGALARADRLDFQYSTDATSLTTGVWTNADSLDFTAPTTAGSVGALDGNLAANRTAINFTITPVSIANGGTFWIRWNDFNGTGADDGLGVDDFSLTPTAPEIEVSGNSTSITDGDTSPTPADDTDFGSTNVAGGTVTHVFTIRNFGNANLNLTGTPDKVVVGGTNAADFTVTVQPSSPIEPFPVMAPGPEGLTQTTFTVVFDPSASGLRTATLSIANDDSDENPFDFAIQGTGTVAAAPEMGVLGNGNPIADNDNSPSLTDGTNFGNVDVATGSQQNFFTIANTGNADLILTGIPLESVQYVSISGPNAADFEVTQFPISPVPAGSPTTFAITFNPSAAGTRDATVTIPNNDADENPYNFAIQGTGTSPPPPTCLAPHQYYRYVIDSVGANTDGYSSVNELQLRINGSWVPNSNGVIGNSTQGLVRFGPAMGTNYFATVRVTDECCGRDLGKLFNGQDDVSWVAGYPYQAFQIGSQGDSIVADSIWAKFDFGMSPVTLEGMRIFGDPWNNGGAPGAEAPDRFRVQYSDDGVNYFDAYNTATNVSTISGSGFNAYLCGLAPPPIPGDLYGATGGNSPADFYQINIDTGEPTLIGAVGFKVGGMDAHPVTGVIYAAGRRLIGSGPEIDPTAPVLLTIDKTTGAGTEIGPLGGTAGVGESGAYDVSFRSDGTLFLSGGSSAPGAPDATASSSQPEGGCVGIHRVNLTTGLATALGGATTCSAGNGLGFSPTDQLFLADSHVQSRRDILQGTLWLVNQTTGLSTQHQGLSFSGFANMGDPRINAMDFNPTTGVAFVSANFASVNSPEGDSGPNYLGILNTTTGEVTNVGTTINGLDALTFIPSAVVTADLSITKTLGQSQVYAGGPITYTIVASNAGPAAVIGATVSDTFPAAITGVTWTCVGAGGGTCPANGAGNINALVNLPAGGTATFTATGTVSVTSSGSIVNTATITPPPGVNDPTPANASASAGGVILGQADLAITKTDGITNFTAPGQTTYTIVVTNSGPHPAVNALVTDNFPAGVTVDNWTCLPQNQAFCTLAGAGNINQLVYIPVGGILTYTATATVAANQTGQLINTATVTAPPTVVDPNTANNSSTDTDNFVVSISGNVKQFVSGGNTNLAGVTLTLAGTNAGTATSGADGNYTFTNLTSGGTWTITPSMSGKVFDPTSRTVTGATANVTGVNFIAYNGTGGIPRNIFVVNTHATPGNPVTVPIRMTSQGTEKVMTFSIDYPIGVLNTPVVACGASTPGCTIVSNIATLGKVGVSITAAGAGVAAGLREIATVTFQTNVGFAPPNAALNFSTTPTAQSVRDAAGNELQKTFTNGFVVFVDGVEGDVAGRNTGDGNVLTTDVTQVRRFVVGTDTVNLSFNEFQRADAAPMATFGDGALLPGDVIQARRYSARLDNLQAAAGPAGPPPPPLGPTVAPIEEIAETSRVIRTERVTADPGQQVTVGVDIEPQGDEMAAAFTLEYNAARLGNARVTLADDAPEGAVLTVNSDDATSGRIGILIDANQPFARDSSARRLVNVTFDVAASSAGGEARIRFTDGLAKRGVSDDLGNTLDARYTDGAVMISGPEARGYELTGRVTTPDGRGLRGAQVTIVDENGVARTVTTSAFGFYRFEDLAAGENYMVSVTSRRHRFAARTITLNDNLADVDFAAQE